LLAGWAEIQRRRFANYLELATQFNAFMVADVTAGWDDPRTLAQDTLAAVREIVSDRWGFRGVRILWFDDEPDMSSGATQMFLLGMRGVGVSIRYGLEPNRSFAREARCYGAVARATTIDTLFSAVMLGLTAETRPRVSNEQRLRCIEESKSRSNHTIRRRGGSGRKRPRREKRP
jgi:hypothetical protein